MLQRTNLSRAQIFRILSDLKKGEYIMIEKGKLMALNKALPNDY
ncbi:helix-turn-helix domain-containing protein [Vibrio hibernica]